MTRGERLDSETEIPVSLDIIQDVLPNNRSYIIDGVMFRPSYELSPDRMKIKDTIWGDCEIGSEPYDKLLINLSHTPVFRRTLAIEQLTLSAEYTTMPNTSSFSRWQHIWGSVVFVRKMLEGDEGYDDREKMVLQLRTLLSDLGHTAFSHLGDWMFQGAGGEEDLHDDELKSLLGVTGIESKLEEYGFSLDETVFPETEDWVECPSPDLCVDRVDYGLREIKRWADFLIDFGIYDNPKDIFELTPDNKLAFKDKNFAKLFSAGYSILPTEHWAHPVHLLQLQLLQAAVENSVVDRARGSSNEHPRDVMYGIDNDFSAFFKTWDNLFIDRFMKEIGASQREIYATGRKRDLEMLFTGIHRSNNWQYPDYPDPLVSGSWQSNYYVSPFSPHLEISVAKHDTEKAKFEANDRGLTVRLSPLKHRFIDPLIILDKGGYGRLSEDSVLGESYKRFLQGQKAIITRGYLTTILMRKEVARKIEEDWQKTRIDWQHLLDTTTRDPATLGRIILDSHNASAAYRLENVHYN